MKKTLLFLFITTILLSACTATTKDADSGTDTTLNGTSSEITTITSTETHTSAVSEKDISGITENNAGKSANVNGKNINLSDNEWTELLATVENLKKEQTIFPKSSGEDISTISYIINDEQHIITHKKDFGKEYISIDDCADYNVTPEIKTLFARYSNDTEIKDTTETSSPEERLIGLSISCEEPTCNEEYLDVARMIVGGWLNSLCDEEGEYKLENYGFIDALNDSRVFLGDGIIDGGREFACYVAFDTFNEDEESVFYANGTYDTFYHYYFGPGVLARFRWENGICTLIDYDEAYALLTSDRIKEGLYGIKTNANKYKTFYDFMNDKDNISDLLSREISVCRYRCSHNVMMLTNDEIIFVDIGENNYFVESGEYVKAPMYRYFYDQEGNSKYSSPVDYIDGSGPVMMEYRKDFPLQFDDYNHDGNPDYAIRISSDENGSTYDVSCMNVSGTPWEDNDTIYIYDEFDESIRLQISDDGNILKRDVDSNGNVKYVSEYLFEDKSKTEHDIVYYNELTDYRMYSQRFFMPESLRNYTSSDQEITCYFWNNTDEAVNAGGTYSIERWDGDTWKTETTKNTAVTTVNPHDHAEIKFDISDITEEKLYLYRVKMTVNGKDVYGGFYMGNKSQAEIVISSEEHPVYTYLSEINFNVKNTGFSAVYPDSVKLYKNSTLLYTVPSEKLSVINSGKSMDITITSDDTGTELSFGIYEVVITVGNQNFKHVIDAIQIPYEEFYYFPEKATVRQTENGLSLELKNNIWDKSTAKISYLDVQVFRNGMWMNTTISVGEDFETLSIPYGEATEIKLSTLNEYLVKLEEYFYGELMDTIDDEEALSEAEIKAIKNMTFDEFLCGFFNITNVEQGDFCRARIYCGKYTGKIEYIYFEMP